MGGGFLILRGKVLHDQPELADGFPLKPSPPQLVVRDPVLISGEKVLIDLIGGTSVAEETAGEPQVVNIYAPGRGRFVIALQQFAAAVRGEANWGR